MPGVNITGRPNPDNIWLGRGSITLGRLDSTTGKPYDFRHVGNCKALTLNIETETLDHQNSRTGVKVIDREIALSTKYNVSMTLDELSFDNLAIFFSGEAAAAGANPAAALTGGSALTDFLIATDAITGRWYALVGTGGIRLMDIKAAGLVVESGASSAANLLAVGTDYELDAVWGRIFIPSTSTFTDGHNLYITYTGGTAGTGTTFERPIDSVTIGTQSAQSYFLKYVGINPANDDQEMLVELHSVKLKPEGDLNFIGDEFSELVLTGVAEKNETGFPDSPVGKAYYHSGAA